MLTCQWISHTPQTHVLVLPPNLSQSLLNYHIATHKGGRRWMGYRGVITITITGQYCTHNAMHCTLPLNPLPPPLSPHPPLVQFYSPLSPLRYIWTPKWIPCECFHHVDVKWQHLGQSTLINRRTIVVVCFTSLVPTICRDSWKSWATWAMSNLILSYHTNATSRTNVKMEMVCNFLWLFAFLLRAVISLHKKSKIERQ